MDDEFYKKMEKWLVEYKYLAGADSIENSLTKTTEREIYNSLAMQVKAKISCSSAYNGRYLTFIIIKAFEYGYFTNESREIIIRIYKDLENAIQNNEFDTKYNYFIM